MIHLPALISDLGLILIAAAVVSLTFKRLGQPVVLGYIVAGFLVGPNFHMFPTVTEIESVKVWAEIGVIFLLFGLGLEFSFKKLASVGKSASITAVFEIIFMLAVGYVLGRALGWNGMDSLFLGGVLSISSTTIIVRAFDELGLKGRQFVTLVFGALVVEDLVAILLLVLLSSVAVAQAVSGIEILGAGARLLFFMILWFVVGVYILPRLMRGLKSYLSDETTLIISVGLCLGMVIVATNAGFSPALGAFVMGSLLAETREGSRIEHLLIPVRDLFAAIFFVSVGMLIDPNTLKDSIGIIILISLVTIFGKTFSTALGALLSGQTLKRSIQSGMSLAQIGEFSFIIATLGMTLKVTSEFLYPIAVAVSAITTFTTPYMIRSSDLVCNWVERRLPSSVTAALDSYQRILNTSRKPGLVSLLWRSYGAKILLNSVVIVAIGFAAKRIFLPMLQTAEFPEVMRIVAGVVALIVATPFIWGVAIGSPSENAIHSPEEAARLKQLQFGVVTVRSLAGLALAAFVCSQFLSFGWSSAAVLTLVFSLALIARRFSSGIYQGIERNFIENLNDKDRDDKKTPDLAPWDAVLTKMVVSPDSNLVSHSLAQSRLKENFGVTVALIERGSRQIVAPGREDLLLPFDRVYLIGNEDNLVSARLMIESPAPHVEVHGQIQPEDYTLLPMEVDSITELVGKSIRDSGLRERIQGLIVGIERDGQRYLSPDSSMELKSRDRLWVVGNRKLIRELLKKKEPSESQVDSLGSKI